MNLAGCQINPNDVNFHLEKSLEIFDKNSADKKDTQIKLSSLMPIRVNLVTFRASSVYNRSHAMFKTYPNLSNKN